MKKGILALFLYVSVCASAQMSDLQKKSWIQQLDSCTQNCRELSVQLLETYNEIYPNAVIQLNDQAELTVLSFHSYSLWPMHPKDNAGFLTQILKNPRLDVVAPIFTAHHVGSGPQDFAQVQPEQWRLDSELFIKLAHGLGHKVVLQGFSMGGLNALFVAKHFPEKVDRLILAAPSIMVGYGLEGLTCLGQFSLVQWAATPFFTQYTPDYSDK